MTQAAEPNRHSNSQVVYLSNLAYEVYEGAIRDMFAQEGIQVAKVQLMKKGSSNRTHNSGLASVILTAQQDVDKSCKQLDGKPLYGRPVLVRRDKFEADQPGYKDTQPLQEHLEQHVSNVIAQAQY
eukprot:GHRR01005233.1.p1 GENE.GHRR01005233.1~~GHRR01005233.1.p1  ORF type:complete len:126 (+),score=37.94 GHRR01005233.1:1998-2375(+)